MTSLIILVVFLMVVTRCAGACLRLTDRSLPRDRRQARAALAAEQRAQADARREALASPVPPAPETPLESLQRRFAKGDITVEHYEREVGRLFGLKSAG